MTGYFQNIELKKIFQVMVVMVIVLLAVITALGTKQYFLYKHCRQAVALSDQLLFGFTSIKEHISETLLTGGTVNIQEANRDIQAFDGHIKKINNDILIPKEFKASIISQVDLVDLIVQLRAVQGSSNPTPQQLTKLTGSLRSISGRLLHFHEVLSAYTNSLLLGLHRVMVGTLSLSVFVVCSILFYMQKSLFEPIIRLHQSVVTTEDEGVAVKPTIAELDRVINRRAEEKSRLTSLLSSLGNVRDTLPDYLDAPEFWETLCQALQTNPDYLLVWVGLPAAGNEFPTPVTGCGCVSSSPVECRQAINHLITWCKKEDGLCGSARRAVSEHRPVITTVPASLLPDQLAKSMPFRRPSADGTRNICCASFPIIRREELLAVVTVYSSSNHCFTRNEQNLLDLFFQQLSSLPQTSPLSDASGEVTATGIAVYKYSVLGAMAGHLVHEMINTINGSLNYSQALLDLMSDRSSLEQERLLLEKLHQQELKNAALNSDLTSLTAETVPENVPLETLLEQAAGLLQGQCKQNGIRITVDTESHLPALPIQGGNVLPVLLTLLQRAVVFLSDLPNGTIKEITVQVRSDDKQVSVAIDNCPPEWNITRDNQDDGSPWPDLSTCSLLLQQAGASLEVEKKTGTKKQLCILYFPLAGIEA